MYILVVIPEKFALYSETLIFEPPAIVKLVQPELEEEDNQLTTPTTTCKRTHRVCVLLKRTNLLCP